VLAGVTDRVLYLDADILCFNRVDELVDMDISQDIAVVVPDARSPCSAGWRRWDWHTMNISTAA
jgi:lipopolysaccharide biosynthesis glycosyltransferase